MFGIGRRKTQGQLARAELNQGIGHLRQAATHAAKGAGATVGPRVQAARGAVGPTAIVVRDRAPHRLECSPPDCGEHSHAFPPTAVPGNPSDATDRQTCGPPPADHPSATSRASDAREDAARIDTAD